MASMDMISCDDCECMIYDAHYGQKCPVCTLRAEMEAKIKKLEAKVEEALCGVQEYRRERPIR